MGDSTGFSKWPRQLPARHPVDERVRNWTEFYESWPEDEARRQAGRCMDCGVPFCNSGCPLGNLIPDWNDLVYGGDWRGAIQSLHATNNFPEFTGRICPAPCEAACTLAINQDAVAIEHVEKSIAERAWSEGWIVPQPPAVRTGKTVAVVGSGPAGLACAQQLNRAGHSVTVLERNEYIGGLLALGIPDFKLEKAVVERRVRQMEAEGVIFRTGVRVGQDMPAAQLREQFDAVCLCGGSTVPRDLDVPGRDLGGVHFAMDYLTQQNRINRGQQIAAEDLITARDKVVVVLGGGDTGSDCMGTAHRQGARRVIQFELLPQPPLERRPDNPWPQWPATFRTTAAHEEGGETDFNIQTTRFEGESGRVTGLVAGRLDWESAEGGGPPRLREIPGSEFTVETGLVLLAMGFLHPEHVGLLEDLGVELDQRGNVRTDERMMTSVAGVFAGGDMQRGQSLVVYAIAAGRMTARGCDAWLTGESSLPRVRGYQRRAAPA